MGTRFPIYTGDWRSCVELLPVVVTGRLGAMSNGVGLHVSLGTCKEDSSPPDEH